MIGKGTGAMDDIDFFQEGAKITVYYEDGSSDVFYPAKVIDGNSSMTAFTLNGFENGEQLPLFWNCYSSGGLKAGANEVELRADWHHIETECYCTVTVDKPAAASMAANPLTIKAKTAMVKYSKLKKKAQTLAVTNVMKFTKDAKDKKTYTLSSAKKGSKSFKKYFKISKTTGKVTVKKGLKKGTYKVKVKVKALGNSKYKASGTKTVTFTIKVK